MREIKVYQNDKIKELGDLYGIFFEDINHAADGGLYAELIQNRSFEFDAIDNDSYDSLTAWELSDGIQASVQTDRPLNKENIHYISVCAKVGDYIINKGFNSGIHVEKDSFYRFSIFARVNDDKRELENVQTGKIEVEILGDNNEICAKTVIDIDSTEFEKYEVTLNSQSKTVNGRLKITFIKTGIYDLDMVSLFPMDTFNGRENGMRRDIAEVLKELKPKFMRFPGGCLVHDGNLDDHARDSMYRWKRTIGRIEERPSWRNNWRYNQTLGLGFYEYFVFCEDIGAKPLPVLPGGFNPHRGIGVSIDKIGEWVQDALDLIEFATGDADTKWGRRRIELGHEEPFELEYIGIGNEEIGDGFFERYPYFHKAIKERYPDIKIINTAGPFATGEGYDAGWKSAIANGSDLVDEHYYSSPEWFLANMHHYDDFDKNGPGVFLGEYASWGNTYYNAIVEAAYMTHLEKAPAVKLACYAPLLCNKDYVNWQPDMIWFDNHDIVKTANYYVQQMFMNNQGTDEIRYEATELEDTVRLIDKDNIDGTISIIGNGIEGTIWNIIYKDITNNIINKVPDISLYPDNTENICVENVDTDSYSIEFNFKRSSGRKGFALQFGKKDDNNLIRLEFGGWDNWDCNIAVISNGRGSTISHRIFHVEDIEYKIRLVVEGRRIQTYVNGELYNDTAYQIPEIEDLYICASEDDNKTYTKIVNLTGDSKEVRINLDGCERTEVSITRLYDTELTAMNTFDNKELIRPQLVRKPVINNAVIYEVPAHSVNVFAFS